jgi:hypothetical protein
MRSLLRVVSGIVALSLPFASGCGGAKPPPMPTPAVVVPPSPLVTSPRPDLVPKVIRRIAKEQQDLVERSRSMAAELRDPSGRARALREVDEIATELTGIQEKIGPGDETPSEVLDAAIDQLQLLDTRIVLLHGTLRAATERTTAVLLE